MLEASHFAVFFGTFSPIHRAHIDIGRAVCRQYGYHQIRYILSPHPPNKPNQAHVLNWQARANIMMQALAPYPELILDPIEQEREGLSHSIDTILTLKSRHHIQTRLPIIMGWDCYLTLPQWHRVADIVLESHLIIVPRPEMHSTDMMITDRDIQAIWADHPSLSALSYSILDYIPASISSTEIRLRRDEGLDYDHLIGLEGLSW